MKSPASSNGLHLLFSGGKDSITLVHLALKAFRPGKFPFPLVHIDTGHNFPEALAFRDELASRIGERLIVRNVGDTIKKRQLTEPGGKFASRNALQTFTLLDTIEEFGFDACIGGARRDEEKARAKERIFSVRDEFGGWDPKRQRPELWNIYNGRISKGENVRVFPISNWTELDIWNYIRREKIALALHLFRTRTRSDPLRRTMGRDLPLHPAGRRRPGGTPPCSLSHRRRHDLYRRSGIRSLWDRRHHSGNYRYPDQSNAARPVSTIKSPKRQWKTENAMATFKTQRRKQTMDLLRFITAGSVDDGKSTLIGRLLYDSKSILTDQLEALERQSRNKEDGEIDLALLTDGLRAEREQGITIDVAYKYFSTPRRKFIIADAPGHIQYTRNMVTGASNANLIVILIDARNGIVEQTRRHSIIASLLNIPHVVVAINKMDLVGYSQDRYNDIVIDYAEIAQSLQLKDVAYLPISALKGDNIVERSANLSWYDGPPCWNCWKKPNCKRTSTIPAAACPFSMSSGPKPKTSTTTAAMPARSVAAPGGKGISSPFCPPG